MDTNKIFRNKTIFWKNHSFVICFAFTDEMDSECCEKTSFKNYKNGGKNSIEIFCSLHIKFILAWSWDSIMDSCENQ